MKKIFLVLTIFILVLSFGKLLKAEVIDEEKVIENMKKSLSVPPNAEVKIVDLKPSQFPNFYQGQIEMSFKGSQFRQSIFISTDSRYYFVGTVYDSNLDYDQMRQKMVNLKDEPYKGGEKAKVTIVEYSDLQCGTCKKAHEMFQNEHLIESYQGKVKLVFKGFPLKSHNWAMQAAIGCQCAYEQNPKAFWKMTDQIFAHQDEINAGNVDVQISSAAQSIGLKMKLFNECYDKKVPLDRINADVAEGNQIGIGSTPSFIINGRLVVGIPEVAQYKEVINYFLSQK